MTNTKNTNFIIDGFRMDNGEINVDYFVEQVEIVGNNTRTLYDDARSNRKALSVAKNWICEFINTELRYSGYFGYICTYAQIRKALKNQLEVVENGVVNLIETIRAETA